MVVGRVDQALGGQVEGQLNGAGLDVVVGGQLQHAGALAEEHVQFQQLQHIEQRRIAQAGGAHEGRGHLAGLLQALVLGVDVVVEGGQHHAVPGVVLLQQAQDLAHALHALVAGLLDLHVDAVLGEAGDQLLQGGGEEDLLVAGGDAFGVGHVQGCDGLAVVGGKFDEVGALHAHLGLGLVGVAEVDLLRHQVGVIPVGNRAGDVGLAVQAHVVGQDDHAVLGDGHVGFHHHAGIHAVGIVEGLQRVVGELLVAAAVGDEDGQLAGLAHGVLQGEILRLGQQEAYQPGHGQHGHDGEQHLQKLLHIRTSPS